MNEPSFFIRRRLLIGVVFVFLLPFILGGTRRALRSMRNDVRDWLPAKSDEIQVYRWFQSYFPHEQFVLISWEGCTLDDDRLELLAEKLVPSQKRDIVRPLDADDPQYFKGVMTGRRLVQRLLATYQNLSEEEVFSRLEGSLIGKDHYKTCLVVTLTEECQGKNLRPMLDKIRDLARECNIEPAIEEDTRNFVQKTWDSVILVVREMVVGREQPGGGVRMGGPPVDNVAIDVEGERTLIRLASLSAILGLGISMFCFRSWRLTAMVFWIAIIAAGFSLAAIYFTGNSVDAIAMSMPTLVYVLAISGAIHIINYYHDAVREKGLLRAPERALEHGWFPCTMAAVTTAIGLGSLYTSQVIPISKFGMYSAIGVVATLGLLFLVLPSLLSRFPSREYNEKFGGKGDSEETETVFTRAWQTAGRFVIRNNVAVSVVCAAVMVLFFIPLGTRLTGLTNLGLPHIETSVKLMKYFSSDAEIIHHYTWLEDQIGPLVPMEVVITVDNQKCDLSVLERMRLVADVERTIEDDLPAVGGAMSAAVFAPDIKQVSGSDGVFGSFGAKFKQRSNDAALCRIINKNVSQFRDYLAIESDPDPGLEDLGVTGRVASRLEAHELDTLTKIKRFAAGESVRDKLATIKGIDDQQAAGVEKSIHDWQEEYGKELWRITARVEALSDLDYADFVHDLKLVVEPKLNEYRQKGVEGIDAVYTGMVPLVYQTQHELMRGLFNSLALAFVLIALVMIFVLKSVSAGLLSMIPNVFPVVIIFGAMGWCGMLVDIGSMMCASVALGVAVDDTMHYLTWFRKGMDAGLDRKGAAMMAYQRCGTAMTQTTLVGGVGLSAFAFSTFTPTQQFGVMMLLLLFAALIGDLIFLPALLTGPLGRFFGRRARAKRQGDSSPSEGGPPASATQTEDGEVVAVPMEATKLRVHDDGSHRSHKVS